MTTPPTSPPRDIQPCDLEYLSRTVSLEAGSEDADFWATLARAEQEVDDADEQVPATGGDKGE